jgi:hypothetical protein
VYTITSVFDPGNVYTVTSVFDPGNVYTVTSVFDPGKIVYIDHSIILLLKPVMHNIQNLFIFTMPHIYIKETNTSLMFVTDYRSMYARRNVYTVTSVFDPGNIILFTMK